mmetsp:Transcript_27299/g.63082  ORF Transcript_27299/g.63082 Transcript_27299/m.63082 type:complete len:153 (-) Transcript_27299:1078-1536(-)
MRPAQKKRPRTCSAASQRKCKIAPGVQIVHRTAETEGLKDALKLASFVRKRDNLAEENVALRCRIKELEEQLRSINNNSYRSSDDDSTADGGDHSRATARSYSDDCDSDSGDDSSVSEDKKPLAHRGHKRCSSNSSWEDREIPAFNCKRRRL